MLTDAEIRWAMIAVGLAVLFFIMQAAPIIGIVAGG